MNKKIFDYSKAAKLFVFPQKEEFVDHVNEVQQYLNKVIPNAGNTLKPFTNVINNVSKIEMEDLYLRTFEVQSITTLNIGYIVFGDDYKRGELLVNLNREHKLYEIDCAGELADNLSNVLKLLNVLKDDELRNDLVHFIIVPALIKMIEGFGDDKLAAKEKIYIKHHKTLLQKHESFTIYKYALKALYQVLVQGFDIKIQESQDRSGGFLSSINQEISIES